MSAAREALEQLQAVGGELRLVDGALRYGAPRGAVGGELRGALASAKTELLELIRGQRKGLVAEAMAGAYQRIMAACRVSGPGTPALAERFHAAGRDFIDGRSDPEPFAEALRRWERSFEALPPPSTGCACGGLIVLQVDDDPLLCLRCRSPWTH